MTRSIWVKIVAAGAVAAAAGCLFTGDAPGQAAKAGKKTTKETKVISGPYEPVAPPDQLIAAIKLISEKAKGDMADGEMETLAMRFAVMGELGKLLTLRDNAELKAWGEKTGKAFMKGAREGLDKEDAAAIFKETSKLLVDAEKASKKWAGSKAVPGNYTPANQSLKYLMAYTSEVNGGLRRAMGLPGMRAKEYLEASWAIAEVGNITILFSEKKDWRDWSAKHRDISAGIARQLAKGEFNEAKKSHSALEVNCKSCHDKYQSDIPLKK
jgi:hypothetical protein